MKNTFVTNLYLIRIGKRLKLSRFIRGADPDPKTWNPPFSEQVQDFENVTCTGKNIADCIESLIGVHFMSNNLRRSLQFISDLLIVPLELADLLHLFPDKDLTFTLGPDIDAYRFDLGTDRVLDIFKKYFEVQAIDPHV